MIRFEFNKLIRNKLLNRMLDEGILVNSESLSLSEYRVKLMEKLLEEAEEVVTSDSMTSLIAELADLMEVIYSIAENHQIALKVIDDARLEKRERNGFFDQETYVNYIEVPKNNIKVLEYLAKNKKYSNRTKSQIQLNISDLNG